MKIKKIVLIVFWIICSFTILKAQTEIWNDKLESQIVQVGERVIIPDSYRVIEIDLFNLKNLLESAPLEFTNQAREKPSIVLLPMPDGRTERFAFWESSTMATELQSQFPEIKTYTGQGIDDKAATLKMDLTPHGFHAMILTPNGRVFIDPYDRGNTKYYISYYTKYFRNTDDSFGCELMIEDGKLDELNLLSENTVLTPTGPQLRTYRLCVAATGEYTIYHGGTVPLGLAAVVSSVNRVNGVYEKEVAVRMVLIANNNLVIYTNGGTDPYSNNDGFAMLGQNMSNLSTVIGNSNFDIGHVFSTGGGGVAYLGCVCTSSKAGGVTGSSAPIGDPFDIDYVAHEMGHQFGGNHTFNSVTSSCGGGNRNASTAYEPGSGSTIMAYAGICGADDLQSHSDAYFHVVSFDEIVLYTNSGSGNSCAVNTATGNNAPIITIPSGGFYIPKSTPFALTGSATDPNGDVMSYCWEEYDLGPAGAPGSPSGDAPIFRSWNPSTSPTRIFPRLTNLLNNTTIIGELLPTYARNLKFRLTVRDNRAAGGGVDWKQINFAVDGNSGPFAVTSPNTSVSWSGNSSQNVTWNVASTNASLVNCSNVKILLSTDGGNNFNTVLLASTPNDGSQLVDIPNLPTTQARVKVEAVGNIFFDISNVNFTIVNNPGVLNPLSFTASPLSSSQINLAFTPNASNNNVIVVWNSTGIFTTPSGAPPVIGQSFAGGTLLYNGTTSPTIHTGLNSLTTYYYKAFSYNGATYSSGLISSATTFSIQNPGTFSAFAVSTTDIYIVFTPNIVSNNVVIVWNNSGSFSTPSGTPPATGQPFVGGILLYNGMTSPQFHSGLTSATNYYYKAFSFDGTNYSSGVAANDTTLPEVTTTFPLSVSVMDGWNMVSIPGLHPTDQDVDTWWSGRNPLADVYKWSGSYSSVTTATPSEGYWMLHSGANTYNTGDEYPAGGIQIVAHNPISVLQGWNMIGGYDLSVPIGSLTTTPPGQIVAGTIYGWNGSYFNPANLEPGYGYWVLLSSNAVINFPTLADATPKAVVEDNKEEWGKITLTDATGKSYVLYAVKGEVNLESYQLPPLPPSGMFDVRYGSGRKAEKLDKEMQTIEMRGITYPVKLRVEKTGIRVEDETGKIVNERLKSGEEITITNSLVSKLKVSVDVIPDKYALEQNYPNPFNPSTKIKFSVPKRTQLQINIYNVIGELIQTLADGVYETGYYEVELNAKDLVSGIYIYKMESGESQFCKKMILIK